jgi:hypothetical protein
LPQLRLQNLVFPRQSFHQNFSSFLPPTSSNECSIPTRAAQVVAAQELAATGDLG